MAPSSLPVPRFYREDTDEETVAPYDWSSNNYLSHHCGVCGQQLKKALAKRSCLGTHQVPCKNFHLTLFMKQALDKCDNCKQTDSALRDRSKGIATLRRDLIALQNPIDDATTSSPLSPTGKTSKKASKGRNLLKLAVVREQIPEPDITMISEVLGWTAENSTTRRPEPVYRHELQKQNAKFLKDYFGKDITSQEVYLASKIFAMMKIEYTTASKYHAVLKEITNKFSEALDSLKTNERDLIARRLGWFGFVAVKHQKAWREAQRPDGKDDEEGENERDQLKE